jgi:CBS domain-containing protein
MLTDAERLALAQSATTRVFPKDAQLLAQDGQPSEYLYVIKQGSVQMSIRAENDQDLIIDVRSAGENFGLASMIRGTYSLLNIVTTEDTTCYLFPKDLVTNLLQQNALFGETLLQTSMQRYLERSLQHFRYAERRRITSDRLLLTRPARSLIKRPIVTCPPDASIQQAAMVMHTNHVSSVIVMGGEGHSLGIVTDRDLRSKVVAAGLDLQRPITTIMTSPVITVEGGDPALEALLRMLNRSIHHLLIVDQDQAIGVVTSSDLILLQGSSPLLFANEIEHQTTVDGVAVTLRRANEIVPLMFDDGAHPGSIARALAEVNDRALSRLLRIAEDRLGPPPLPYGWLVLGSEGRKEQIFKTDQANALIYADPHNDRQGEAATAYFARLCDFIGAALERCGYPDGAATFTARNPRWRQPLHVWRDYFQSWIELTEAFDPLVFDLRSVGGAGTLIGPLRDFVTAAASERSAFLAQLARSAVKHTPPIGFFRNFVVEQHGPRKATFDIQQRGIAPIVDVVRLWALANGVRETNTLERLRALSARKAIGQEQADELGHTLEFLLLLRLRHHLEQMEAGQSLDNFINPNMLNQMDRTTIKQAFHIIGRQQAAIAEQYGV